MPPLVDPSGGCVLAFGGCRGRERSLHMVAAPSFLARRAGRSARWLSLSAVVLLLVAACAPAAPAPAKPT